jgi:hypothetical protein
MIFDFRAPSAGPAGFGMGFAFTLQPIAQTLEQRLGLGVAQAVEQRTDQESFA